MDVCCSRALQCMVMMHQELSKPQNPLSCMVCFSTLIQEGADCVCGRCRCYECNEVGHMARDCLRKRRR